MALTSPIATGVPQVSVISTNGRGMTPEEVADLALAKLISVSDTAPPEIAAQARAFRDRMRVVLVYYMKQAIASDRTTVYNALTDAGHPELAELIRRL
jgi:hypothetical protein